MELRKDLQAQAQHHALAASIHPSQQHTVRDSSPGLQRSYSAGQFATTSTWPVALEKPPRPASILSSNPVATHSRPMAQSMAPPIHPYSKVNVNGRGGSAHQVDPQRQYTSNATDKPYEPIPDEFDGRVNDSADQVDSQTHFYAPGVTDKPYLVHPMNCMDHANEWVKCVENCSMQSCGDDCSVSRCTFGCTDSEDCDGSGACTSLDCAESSYPHSFSPCLDESCQLTSFGHAPGFGDDFSNQNFDAGDNDMQCLWLMPGQQCGVSVSTRNALGKHVFHDHIEPQEIVICPVETCAAVIKAQQAPSHLMQQHNPESYACPVQFCGGLFLNHEELDNHLTTTHGLLDCHWAGCEVSTKNSIQLSRHISLDHLNSTGRFQPPQFSWWDQSNVPSQVHEHPTLQFTPQSFASPQVSPFDDDRKDTAEEGSASPFINIFTSSMSSGQPASLSNESTSSMSPYRGGFPHTSPTATKFNGSPYLDREAEGTTQFKNPLHHEPEGNVEPGTDGEKSKCMWVTGGVTGQVCGMTFPDGNALQLHTDQCHVWPIGDKGTKTVLSCDWQNCKRKGKLLQNKEKLRRHLFTHTGFWITTCKECPKRFNNMGALENHARTHSGEKPFSCGTCQQTFATEASLTIHKRSHTGEKPLSCPDCSYVSADSSNMTKHKQIHQPHKYFCPICNKGFSRKGTMNRHLPTHDKNRKEKRKRTKQQKSVSCTENSNREGHEDKDTMAADAEDAEVHK